MAETPEERVRQAFVVTLHNEYGFDLEQMDEELHVAGRGSARAGADLVIWRTPQEKADRKAPLIVVECKADNITIKAADFAQGEAYALYCNAPSFVTHNNRETRYWRTCKELLPGHGDEIENIPQATASDTDIQEPCCFAHRACCHPSSAHSRQRHGATRRAILGCPFPAKQASQVHFPWIVTIMPKIADQFGRNLPFTNFFAVPGCVGSGAWEAKARWSYLDLGDVQRGRYNDLTVGFNWYWSDRTRVMFDWIHPFTSAQTAFGTTTADLLAMRFDFNW